MELIQDQPFTHETIGLDGFAFARCKFEDCVIMIRSEGYDFEQCTFRNVRILLSPEVSVKALARRLATCRCENTVCLRNALEAVTAMA
jgi:hypothetical protein